MKNSDNTFFIVAILLGLGFFAYLAYSSRKIQEQKSLSGVNPNDEILTVSKLQKILQEYRSEQLKALDTPPSML